MKKTVLFIVVAGVSMAAATTWWFASRNEDRYSSAEITAEMIRWQGLAEEARMYFPQGAFGVSEGSHLSLAKRFAAFLISLDEGPLYQRPPDLTHDVYRFTWLRTFDRPVILRVDVNSDRGATFTIKVSDGAGGYIPGKLIRNEVRRLEPVKLQEIEALFASTGFFGLPSFDERDDTGVDGARWIVEAFVGGRYHVSNRWSPIDGGVEAIGSLLIGWAGGRDLKEIY